MSRKLKEPKFCPKCEKSCLWFTGKICHNCYRNFVWKPKKRICKRCRRERYHQAKSLCPGCYNFVFHIERTKDHNYKRKYGIDLDIYKKVTKRCVICGFDKIVDLHHLDHNQKNNTEENLVGLCPNHHKLIHDFRFRREMRDLLKEKGFKLPKDIKLDFSLED